MAVKRKRPQSERLHLLFEDNGKHAANRFFGPLICFFTFTLGFGVARNSDKAVFLKMFKLQGPCP
jgi:hypothetical protein